MTHRLNEIRGRLADVLRHSPDCEDSEYYREDIPFLLSELESSKHCYRLLEEERSRLYCELERQEKLFKSILKNVQDERDELYGINSRRENRSSLEYQAKQEREINRLRQALEVAKKGLASCGVDSEENFGCRGCFKDLQEVERIESGGNVADKEK